MDNNWIFFILIWAIVEFIQYLRKKPLRQRMKTAAIWATISASLSMIGAISSEAYTANPSLSYAVAFGMNAVPALAIYWLRVALSNGWSKLMNRAST